ncbi:Ig-like domain-containing protein [Dysgonomonas macrotermitis]|uniref:Por secretion system C-terminal sorting domain-containing protein n=1 Tax=Dysgonomonas macrotermitis TaxID=1346286 RepID=A0A1M5D4Y2_9BACT|nr:T9SS type A sorting domain-containing protein [Dysgonomonas macrotermitis]SHF62048.1 Por secretion system C-terminal sorting domain-containing protein [Dysgonomonas macrotermitis]
MHYLKDKRKKLKGLLTLLLGLSILNVSAQIYGPEIIVNGDFGTISSVGKNGDNQKGSHIYPKVSTSLIGTYYQPATKLWYNNSLQTINANPTVTIGIPLTSSQTSYTWGLSETYRGNNNSNSYYLPRSSNNKSSGELVSHAPTDGYYVIATTTKGMLNLPVVNSNNWAVTMYDRYETNTASPTNYFMVVNADMDPSKIFYQQKVPVVSGQVYRMSVDLARLNNLSEIAPSVAFVIESSQSVLTTATPKRTIDLTTVATWGTTYFDYIAPCNVGSESAVYVAFRNNVKGGGGNDLVLDNLSMKAIIPQIKADITSTDTSCKAEFTLSGSVVGSFTTGYLYKWQKKVNSVFVDISGQTKGTFTTTEPGDYRLAIYTSATSACPMYSNVITLVKRGTCIDTPRPVAVDDYYAIRADQELTANILTNDSPSVQGAALTVVSFTVNGTKYPSGSSAQIFKDGVLAGVVSISQTGSLVFKSVPGLSLPQQMPDITYIISESNAGEDQAIVRITVTSPPSVKAAIADATCTQCPVHITISGSDLLPGPAYSVYLGDVKKATFDEAYHAMFTESLSGELVYSIMDGVGTVMRTVTVTVHPSSATWKAVAVNDSWSDPANWQTTTGGGYPIWCTDVTLPSVSNIYPTLVDADACRDIVFKSGAAVGQVQRLLYRKAFVELLLNRNRWYMLAAPLRYMYSADYHGDMTWTDAMSPKIFMMYFDVKTNLNPDGRRGYSVGNFSIPFADLEEEVDAGKGFALWVNGKEPGYDYADANFPAGTPYRFPRLLPNGSDVSYSYHDASTGEWLYPSESLARGVQTAVPDSLVWVANYANLSADQKDNRYRFAFEESYSNGSITVPVIPGATNIIGNPFMSYLDFNKFLADNADKVYGYYRIWDGVKFYSYILGGVSEAWGGLSGLTTDTSTSVTGQFVSPMQSFFIETKPGAESVSFKPANISTGGVSSSTALRATSEGMSNVINLTLDFAGVSSRSIVALHQSASLNYKVGEDIKKLFAPGDQTPEIYTFSDDEVASDINVIGSTAETQTVSVGVRTAKTGSGTIKISGIETVDAYTEVVLEDRQLKKEYDLRKVSSVSFEKTVSGNLEDRFFLRLSKKPVSGISDEHLAAGGVFSVRKAPGKVEIESSGQMIRSVRVYNVSGQLIKYLPEVNNTYAEFDTYQFKGAYLITVTTADGENTFKVTI